VANVTKKNTNPNAIRPKSAGDLLRKDYQVNDRPDPDGEKPLKIWGTHLTYDEAWRLKEATNGSRKSTTARVAKMDPTTVAPKANGKAPNGENTGWTEAQRMAAAQRAARESANADALRVAQVISSQESLLIGGPTDSVLERLVEDTHGAPEVHMTDEQLADLMGSESESDIDSLIDEAEASKVLEH
jgi:hypothetical protein